MGGVDVVELSELNVPNPLGAAGHGDMVEELRTELLETPAPQSWNIDIDIDTVNININIPYPHPHLRANDPSPS